MRGSPGIQQTGGSTGNRQQMGKAVTQPTALPSAAPPAHGGATAGGDGSWKTDGGNASSSGPAPTSLTTIMAGPTPSRAGTDGGGKGNPVGGTVTATPTGGTKAVSTPTASPAGTSGPRPATGTGAPGAAQTISLAGNDTRGAAIGSPSASGIGVMQIPSDPIGTAAANSDVSFAGNSTARGPGAGAQGAPTGTIAARPTVAGDGNGPTTVTHAARNGSGVQAHRTEVPGSRGAGSRPAETEPRRRSSRRRRVSMPFGGRVGRGPGNPGRRH